LIALSLFFLSLNWNIHSRPRVLGTYVNNSSKGISFNETLTFKDDNTFLYFLSTATMERYSEGNYSIKNNKILFNCGLMTRPGFINIDGFQVVLLEVRIKFVLMEKLLKQVKAIHKTPLKNKFIKKQG
jgi:hypothetical protein